MSFAKARATKRAHDIIGDLSDLQLLTPSEVARRTGISRRQVGRLVRSGKLHPIWTGARYRIAFTDLERFLATARVGK